MAIIHPITCWYITVGEQVLLRAGIMSDCFFQKTNAPAAALRPDCW